MEAATGLDVSVVLPTYNESASLPVLVPRIVRALEAANLHGEVIVVDDNSPDDTAQVASELAKTYPVRVKKRVDERGLATAVIAGFAMSQATVCVVMDADGSHPVEALGQMVCMILEDKAEIVVGSRHVEGGGSKDWPLFSQLKSRFAASLAIGLTSMTDPTTGFMAIRRTLLEKLELDPVGWKIVLEAVVKAHPARLAEVPIVFTDREHGESKQSLRVLEQYLEHLYKLYKFRFPALIELLKFCLVGFLGVFVDLSLVFGLKHAFAMDTRLCQVFGFGAAVTFNYAINRRFSFEHARNTPLLASYVAYVGANLVGLTVRMLAIDALMRLTSLDRGNGYLLLSGIGIALATLVNFVGVKYFAFAPRRAAEASEEELAPNLEHTGPSRASALLVLVFALLALGVATFSGARPRTHDERVNLVMADNIRAGFDGLVHPAITPGFASDWQRDALPTLGNTPIYPLLLAASEHLGAHGPDLSCLLVFALLLAGGFLAISGRDHGSARATIMLAASAPWMFAQFGLVEFEPLVAALCALGFAGIARGSPEGRLLPALGGGLALGLGFATKMWLVLPGLFATSAYLVARAYAGDASMRARVARAAGVAALGFVIAAGSHLLFVALTSPGDLRAWVHWVYLGIFSGRGATGPKLSGSVPGAAQASSAFSYVMWLARDHGALFAPIVLGLPAATRRIGSERKAWFSAVLGAFAGLVPLSVPAVKEPLYMAPVLPFFYLLAGLAVVAPDRTPPRYARVNRGAARASLVVAAVCVLAWLFALASSPGPTLVTAALHVGHVAIWTWPSLRVLRGKDTAHVIFPCALGSLLIALILTIATPESLAF